MSLQLTPSHNRDEHLVRFIAAMSPVARRALPLCNALRPLACGSSSYMENWRLRSDFTSRMQKKPQKTKWAPVAWWWSHSSAWSVRVSSSAASLSSWKSYDGSSSGGALETLQAASIAITTDTWSEIGSISLTCPEPAPKIGLLEEERRTESRAATVRWCLLTKNRDHREGGGRKSGEGRRARGCDQFVQSYV